ncbi:MAG: hypothetical protein IJM33_00870 [Bacteroidales bacterium]|nr:hypothetical protein [Bacteroidales bacterium]MBR3411683.1 hypothetical protein [Bacteroidales bacterium]
MKLRKLVLPMLAIMLLAAGCTKEYYGAQIQTFQFQVNPGDWLRNQGPIEPGANNYLYYEKAIPAIGQNVFLNGTVQAYCWNVYDTQNNLGSWNTLPFVYPLEVYLTNEEGEQELVIVPENLRFEWELGKVTIVIQDLDGYDPESMELAGPITFKVCVTSNM